MWDAAKVVLRRNFIAVNAYIRKKVDLKSYTHIDDLSFYLKKQEQQMKPKVSRRKEMILFRAENK